MNPNCPNCGAALSYFGEALMCSYSCEKCDFRISIVDANGPAILGKILSPRNPYVAQLEDIIKHVDIHGAYSRGGYKQMTTEQKEIFDRIARRPWSDE